MLFDLSLADAVMEARKIGEGKPYRILVLRQCTLEPMAPYLVTGGRDFGLEIEISFGRFDAMVQDVLEDDLWQPEPDCIMVAPLPTRYIPQVVEGAGLIAFDEQAADIETALASVEKLITKIRERSRKPVLWLGFYRPFSAPLGLSDERRGERSLESIIRRINLSIDNILRTTGPGWVIDMEGCAARVGWKQFYDRQRECIVGLPFTSTGLREISIECLKYIRNLTGGLKKVLALDCDDTLWSGLVGEIGPEEVDFGLHGFPALGHRNLQRLARCLKERGVLIVLVSKNEEANVWEVFETRKDMILRRCDIAASRINWSPKAENLISIAEELNLALDSFVFIDDQMAEIEAVRRFCPEVTCLHLSKKNLLEIDGIISSAGWFESTEITETDRTRVELYQADIRRDEMRARTLNIESFLVELSMDLEIKIDKNVDTKRASQLCQRTNQFNFTGIRYTATDIEEFIRSDDASVISLAVRDKFGPLGDVALAIITFTQERAYLDTLVLSCRAFGRYCEYVLLEKVAEISARRNIQWLVGRYVPTSKNAIIRDFWSKNGFNVEVSQENIQTATISLHNFEMFYPKIFRSIKQGE